MEIRPSQGGDFMGNIVGCSEEQVRFGYYMDEGKKGRKYYCALTVEEYDKGILTLSWDKHLINEFYSAPYAAEAFMKSSTSVGTAKLILNLKKRQTVKAVRINLKREEGEEEVIIKSILVPKSVKTQFSIKA